LYRVTDIGRRELQSSASRRKRNDQEILIDRLEASVAVKKMNNGDRNGITFDDACRFWRGFRCEDMAGLADDIKLVDAVAAIDTPQCRILANTHRWLLDRFQRHLKLAKVA
jgi:hypothetical protein